MIFCTWEDRTEFLAGLQQDLRQDFGKEDYNVFIFGSFVTTEYNPEKSDIDLAVFSMDYLLTRKIVDYLEDYLTEREIPHSIIIIDLAQRHAFISLDPLCLNIGCTDYYPLELQMYKAKLMRNLIWYNEEKALCQRLFPVRY